MTERQRRAILDANKKRWLKELPTLTEDSGIYIITRTDENGIKYAYVGQAVHLLTRLAQHFMGFQAIDNSLKKHGLSYANEYGYTVEVVLVPNILELDDKEKQYVLEYATKGYQMKNKTFGGQGKGKQGLGEKKPSRGYYDGKKQGYEDCKKYVTALFEKYLTVGKKQDGKLAERKLQEFKEWLEK